MIKYFIINFVKRGIWSLSYHHHVYPNVVKETSLSLSRLPKSLYPLEKKNRNRWTMHLLLVIYFTSVTLSFSPLISIMLLSSIYSQIIFFLFTSSTRRLRLRSLLSRLQRGPPPHRPPSIECVWWWSAWCVWWWSAGRSWPVVEAPVRGRQSRAQTRREEKTAK